MFNLSSCHRPSPRQQIHALFNKLEHAIETKNIKECFTYISKEYSDSADFSYHTLHSLAFRAFQHYRWIDIVINNLTIKINGKTAICGAYIDVTAMNRSYEIERSSAIITFKLKREKNSWKIVKSKGWQSQLD